MEEINVAQSVEQAVEDAVLPNNNLMGIIGLGITGIGLAGAGYLAYKGISKLVNKYSKSKQVDEKIVVDVQPETEETTNE